MGHCLETVVTMGAIRGYKLHSIGQTLLCVTDILIFIACGLYALLITSRWNAKNASNLTHIRYSVAGFISHSASFD